MTYKSQKRNVGSQDESPVISQSESECRVGGYQNYMISKSKGKLSIKYFDDRRVKYQIIRPYLNVLAKTERIMDLGCSGGGNGMQAIVDGFRSVLFVDHDCEYANLVSEVLKFTECKYSRVVCSKFSDIKSEVDVAMVFALIHWIYASTEEYNKLDKIISKLHSLSPKILFIEWVDREDSAVLTMVKNKYDHPIKDYNRDNFINCLQEKYSHVENIGFVTNSREIYIASTNKIRPNFKYLIQSKLALKYYEFKNIIRKVKIF
jgi:hypothetical protein